MKKILLTLLLLFLSTPTVFAEKRPFSIEDFYRLKSLSELALSPDGTSIAFTVTGYRLEKGEKRQAVWISKTDGSRTFRLTSENQKDHGARWSPDGKTVAFISDRSGEDQIYRISTEGGEAEKVTSVSTGMSDLLWSPDGTLLVFTSSVYAECGADDACSKDIKETWENGPLQAHMADHLLYRHWDTWKDGRTAHILSTDLHGNLKDLSPGPYESPVFSIGATRGYDLSPDGKALAFASKRVPHPAESTNSDIFVEPLTEKTAELTESSAADRTAANEAADACPRFSPDGRSIAYLTQRVPGYESDLWRLALLDVESGKTRLLTDRSNFDYWVDQFEWSRDGRKVYFTAQVHGETPLYRLHVDDGRIEKLLSHATIDAFAVDPEERFAVYIRRSVGEPWEVYRYDLDGGKPPKRLTDFNQSVVQEVDIRPAERLTVPGAEGKPVELFLVKPHGFDPAGKYPLILNIHGGPQMEWLDSFRGDWQVYPGAGYIVAFPNPHGSTGYGQDYTDEIAGDYGGKVYEDILRVTDYLETLPFVDKKRMGAMGWSWGGYMMDWFLGHTDRFQCLASMMGVYDLRSMFGATEELWFPEWDLKGTPWTSPLYEKWSPSAFVKNYKTPTLIVTGENDFRVPYTQSLQLFTALQKMRVPSRLVVFSRSGHWPSWYEMAFYYLAHLDWFHRYLGGAPAPWPVEDFLRNRVFKETAKTPRKGTP